MAIASLKHIYVAGHTGLIGSAVMRRLEREGVVDIITATRREVDLMDQAAVEKFFDKTKPAYVILAAGHTGGIVENKEFPANFINNNLVTHSNIIRAAHRTGVKKLIMFASSCMYPRECPQPMAESALFTGVPEPTSMAYCVAKMAAVQMCLAFNQQYGETKFIPLIPNTVYGPNDNYDLKAGHVLSVLMRRFHEAKQANAPSIALWGTGAPKREFIHVNDVVDACLAMLTSDVKNDQLPMNVGSGKDLSIRELAESIAKLVGYTGKLEWDTSKPDGAPRKLLDSSRIRTFGWKPVTDFEEGLEETYAWYLDNVANARMSA